MSYEIPLLSRLPGDSGTIEDGQIRKSPRDLLAGVLAVVGVALVTYALENAGVISSALPIDETSLVTLVSVVAGLFGWRTLRP